jgi:hypothetical protein
VHADRGRVDEVLQEPAVAPELFSSVVRRRSMANAIVLAMVWASWTSLGPKLWRSS